MCGRVKEIRDPGVYEVKFDGSNLASGVYFSTLQAGDFVAIKRLMLLMMSVPDMCCQRICQE